MFDEEDDPSDGQKRERKKDPSFLSFFQCVYGPASATLSIDQNRYREKKEGRTYRACRSCCGSSRIQRDKGEGEEVQGSQSVYCRVGERMHRRRMIPLVMVLMMASCLMLVEGLGSCKEAGLCCTGRDASCVVQKTPQNAIIEDLRDQ